MGQITKFAADELGISLTPGQRQILDEFEAGEFETGVLQCGRRGGKSMLADILVLFDVALRDHLRSMPVQVDGHTTRPAMSPGERRVAAIVSPSQRQSNAHIRTCLRLTHQSALLSDMLVSATTDELVYSNGSAILSFPASAPTIRGGEGWSIAVLDEAAYFMDSTEGPASGEEVFEAVVPALAQFGSAGWLIAISTPRWRQGMFYRLTEQARSGKFPSNFYVQMSTAAMNPGISAAWLERKRQEDPEFFRRVYGAEFTDSEGAYLDASEVRAAVRKGGILPPVEGIRYVGWLDPAFAGDDFAMSVGYLDGKRVVVVGVWAWHRRGYDATLDAVQVIADRYRLNVLGTDQWSSEAIRAGLEHRGIIANVVNRTPASNFESWSRLKMLVNTARIELPGDDDATILELCDLEARPTPGGFTRIAAAGSGHDDRAVAVAGVVMALKGKREHATFDLGAAQPRGAGQPGGHGLGFGGGMSKWDGGGGGSRISGSGLVGGNDGMAEMEAAKRGGPQ